MRWTWIAAMLVLSACGDANDANDAARKRWDRNGGPDYQYRYITKGFVARIEADICVHDNQVIQVECVGESECSDRTLGFTMEQLFDRIDRAYDNGDEVEVTYGIYLGEPEDAYFSQGGEGDGFEAAGLSVVWAPAKCLSLGGQLLGENWCGGDPCEGVEGASLREPGSGKL